MSIEAHVYDSKSNDTLLIHLKSANHLLDNESEHHHPKKASSFHSLPLPNQVKDPTHPPNSVGIEMTPISQEHLPPTVVVETSAPTIDLPLRSMSNPSALPSFKDGNSLSSSIHSASSMKASILSIFSPFHRKSHSDSISYHISPNAMETSSESSSSENDSSDTEDSYASEDSYLFHDDHGNRIKIHSNAVYKPIDTTIQGLYKKKSEDKVYLSNSLYNSIKRPSQENPPLPLHRKNSAASQETVSSQLSSHSSTSQKKKKLYKTLF